MADIILKIENLSFSYTDTEDYAVKNLSIEFERGKRTVFMGANGSGKSTLFLCMNGIHRPMKGSIYLENKKIEYTKIDLRKLRSKVGYVFQDPDNQLFSASVKQEISFGPLNMGKSTIDVEKDVDKIIEVLDMKSFKNNPTHSLSGGQKKQVSIADILVMNPDIVILDEPTAYLDPKHSTIVNGIVDKMVDDGITIIISTHDVDFALEWGDDIVIMHQGEIIAHDSPEKIFSDTNLLEKTNLKQPASMEVFNSLVNKGILKNNLSIPKNLKELESYIEGI